MNIYLVTRNDEFGYDQYDDFVVAADSRLQAKNTHPNGDAYYNTTHKEWRYIASNVIYYNHIWVNPDEVTVRLIGVAAKSIKRGVICASFNAG